MLRHTMGRENRLAGEGDAEPIQGIYAPIVRDTAISFELEPRERLAGGGVGRALYGSLLTILALQGYHGAYAGITLPNAARVGLHEAVGFAPVGVYRGVGYKLGAWHDVGWWQHVLRPRLAAPEPPVDLPSVRGSAGFTEALAAGRPQPRIA